MSRGTGRVNGLILSAGAGPGLRPLGGPALTPIAGRTPLEVWAFRLAEAGAGEIRLVSAPPGPQPTVRPPVVPGRTPTTPGTAAALRANADLAEDADDVLVVRSDFLSAIDLAGLLREHRRSDAPLTTLLAPGDARETDLGVYAFRADAYREAAESGVEELSDVLRRFEGRSRGWGFVGGHYDLGDALGLSEARERAPALLVETLRPSRPSGRPAHD